MNVLLINGSPHKKRLHQRSPDRDGQGAERSGHRDDDLPHRLGAGGRLCGLRRLQQGGQMRVRRPCGRRAAAGREG